MAENSKIQWTDHTFNPWVGCAKVHTGCASCYAEALMADRYGRVKWGPTGTRSKTKTWGDPPRWDRQAAKEGRRFRVFCASLADVFEDRGDLSIWRRELFQLIDRCRNLDWLLLTKRPENVSRMWYTRQEVDACGRVWGECKPTNRVFERDNVWLGTSIADQATADEWLPRLIAQRAYAKVLFCSFEPAIGPADLTPYLSSLDWVIIGGESKQGRHTPRPFHVEWAQAVAQQCAALGVPCFVKQLGSDVRYMGRQRKLVDSHGGNPDEWVADIRAREFPEASVPV